MSHLLPNGNILNPLGQEVTPNGYNLGYSYHAPLPSFGPVVPGSFPVAPLPEILPSENIINAAGQEIMPDGYNLGFTLNSPLFNK